MYNFALAGCGAMAHWHAQQLQKIPGVQVVALVDPDPHHLYPFREKYFPTAKAFGDFQSLLKEPPARLDAAVLVTPHAVHYPQAKAALEHGLHVLVEKPMVTHTPHAYDLWRTAQSAGKLLGISFQAPYTPEFEFLARQRDSKGWGKVQLISGWLSQGWLEATRGTWRQEPAIAGGGMMYDSGAHLLNAILWLMDDAVVEVGCFYDRCESPVEINGAAIIRFQQGTVAAIAIGGNCPPFRTEIQIQTDVMMIVTDQYGGKLELTGRDGRQAPPTLERDGAMGAAAGTPHANFVSAMAGHQPLRCGARHGAWLSVLMDALYESGQSGKIVKPAPAPRAI
jgi:predicted dehydrogenase